MANSGIIFNLQRYSIHDGPGIRTTVFLKGCGLKCMWCQNPESQHLRPEVFLNRSKCGACGVCVEACPRGANSIVDGGCAIDRKKCDGCGACAQACPNGARTIMGRWATVEEVMSEVVRDKRFYTTSGGGVTLSGGEPTHQHQFAAGLLKACKAQGFHTAIETCGDVSWPVLEGLLNHLDLVLFDIKHLDAEKHRSGTGKPNGTILDNARKVARCKPMRVRVPVIPGFNDTAEDLKAITRFAREELGGVEVDLLPYNRMGESKYEFLGRDYLRVESGNAEKVEALRAEVCERQ
jgi:pyruvate formate lyase activating enzyme